MNFLKLATVIGLFIFVARVDAAEGKIDFHLGCYPASNDCIEFQFSSGGGKAILAKKEPEMTLSQSQISEAELVKGEFGQEQLQLQFEKAAAEKFGQVTRDNVGKQLVVVANGKALIAPNIQQAITGGNMVINVGADEGNNYLDGLPWLKKMAEEKKASREGWSLFSIIAFVVLGLASISGAIYFAFFGKRASSS